MALGAKGVISVLSNIAPKLAHDIAQFGLDGDFKKSAELQLKYIDLCNALFCDVNPIPVKAAMAKMGFCEDYLRLPLTPMEDKTREVLYNEMRKVGINI